MARRLLRSVERHGRRTSILIDAQSVLGAVRKGRSLTPSLKREIRFIGSLVLAGDLLLRCLYIPSEDNPADAPLRGVVRKHSFSKRNHAKSKRRPETGLERDARHLQAFLDNIDNLPEDHLLRAELQRYD